LFNRGWGLAVPPAMGETLQQAMEAPMSTYEFKKKMNLKDIIQSEE
jgi:hypothetical protein